MSDKTQSSPDNLPPIVQDNLKTTYANVCRIAQTPNEVIVDFGLNPNFYGKVLDEPLTLDSRVILSLDSAKRLCIHLANTIQNYESKYGVIELDLSKRLINAGSQQQNAPVEP